MSLGLDDGSGMAPRVDAIAFALEAMTKHPDSANVQKAGMRLVAQLAGKDLGFVRVATVTNIVAAGMEAHAANASVTDAGMDALRGLLRASPQAEGGDDLVAPLIAAVRHSSAEAAGNSVKLWGTAQDTETQEEDVEM